MFLTLVLGGTALASAALSAICFSAAGAAAESPHRWHIDAFFTELVGGLALAATIAAALGMGMRL